MQTEEYELTRASPLVYLLAKAAQVDEGLIYRYAVILSKTKGENG